jgi:hypothetical protein
MLLCRISREGGVVSRRSKWCRASAIWSKHGGNRLAASFCHGDAWHALDDAGLFHECGIELGRNAANHGAIVAGEA